MITNLCFKINKQIYNNIDNTIIYHIKYTTYRTKNLNESIVDDYIKIIVKKELNTKDILEYLVKNNLIQLIDLLR